MGHIPGDKVGFVQGASRDVPKRCKSHERWLITYGFSEEQIAAFISEMLEWQPKFFVGFGSSLYQVASFLQARSLPAPKLMAIESTADQLYDAHRSVVESIFQSEVFNMYGSREILSLACECEQHAGLHVFSDIRLLEIVRDGLPAFPGEEGSIVITDLFNYGMPFIRYEIGDVGTWSEKACSCGRGFPLLADMKGRNIGTLTTEDGRYIHGYYFVSSFFNTPGIKSLQVRQKSLQLLEYFHHTE